MWWWSASGLSNGLIKKRKLFGRDPQKKLIQNGISKENSQKNDWQIWRLRKVQRKLWGGEGEIESKRDKDKERERQMKGEDCVWRKESGKERGWQSKKS